jgi:hypothetical protein
MPSDVDSFRVIEYEGRRRSSVYRTLSVQPPSFILFLRTIFIMMSKKPNVSIHLLSEAK